MDPIVKLPHYKDKDYLQKWEMVGYSMVDFLNSQSYGDEYYTLGGFDPDFMIIKHIPIKYEVDSLDFVKHHSFSVSIDVALAIYNRMEEDII